MKIVETMRRWFQGAAAAKQDRLQEAQKKDTLPPADKGGIGSTPSKIEEAKQEKDWPGDT